MSLVLVVGANGIVGQHLRLCQPREISAVYTARTCALPRDYPLKLATPADVTILLERWAPTVVISLVGENRPDVVEADPAAFEFINVEAPLLMAEWCREWGRRFIHVSTQGVFGGMRAPYSPEPVHPDDPPVNTYGRQKAAAEMGVLKAGGLVARLTFILGIRPFPHVGRANPLEQMLSQGIGQKQVDDRLFSPCFAKDAALELWRLVSASYETITHIGIPISTTRADIAEAVMKHTNGSALDLQRVRHDEAFPAPVWAPRPFDTTFAVPARHRRSWDDGLTEAIQTWRSRLDYMDSNDRADEISVFLGVSVGEAAQRLAKGFGFQHGQVAADFRRVNPQTDDALLAWYRGTDAYIWELTAYHLDKGFNYLGMCEGIVNRLKTQDKPRVLCIGDGVGDLTMKCQDAGLQPIYHDLSGSKTAEFAMFRMKRRYGQTGPWVALSSDWAAPDDGPPDMDEFTLTGTLDAAVALDFFEHMTDVETWVRRVWDMLKPGGLFLAQNAFGIGDTDHEGSIPMHLTRNNRYVKDWGPLLTTIGFALEVGGWWRKP